MSQSGVYNEGKMVWWYAREKKLPEAPKQVQLILSDLCNQDCHFCAYRMSGYTSNQLFVGDSELAKTGHSNPKRWIPTDRALRLVDEIKAAGALSIQFTGGGEPTVHPDHERIFARALELGIRCSLVSNGMRWSDTLINSLLPQFDWVRVSIDAASPETYANTRRCPPKHWDRVWGNVRKLGQAIRETGTPTAFGLGFVVTPESYPEVVPFAELARDAGAHNIRYTAMFSTEDEEPFVRIYDRIRLYIDRAKRLQTDAFKVYDNFGSRFEDLRQHAPDYRFCSYQHYTTYVGGDLQAYRCCVLAYNRRGRMAGGDLSKTTFDKFWRSQARKDDMDALDARGCERCQFNVKNRALLYVMGNTEQDDTPRHLEWP
jgi:MoaA/NifB/PqqE/SkfB family radical SAM enzyme